jgi:hypothetical protein
LASQDEEKIRNMERKQPKEDHRDFCIFSEHPKPTTEEFKAFDVFMDKMALGIPLSETKHEIEF